MGDGYIAGIVVRGSQNHLVACTASAAEVGLVVTGTQSTVVDCQANNNLGHDFVVAGGSGRYVGNLAIGQDKWADDTYDGFSVTGNTNIFVGNLVSGASGDANRHRHGFADAATVGGEPNPNVYLGNSSIYIRRALYGLSSTNKAQFGYAGRQALRAITASTALAYTDDVVPVDASGGAVTVTLPNVAGVAGKSITVKRTSAGANAVTVARGGTSLIDGATSKVLGSQSAFCTVVSDGTNWLVIAQGGTVT
jgi:hypothetical protein